MWSSHLYSQVGYGTNNPDPLSIIHLESTTKALYLPRLSIAQLNAQSGWKDGMLVFNTDSNCLFAREEGEWDCLNLENFDKIESDDHDVVLTLSADKGNDDETHNPRIVFQQDGGLIEARIGITGEPGAEFHKGRRNAAYFGTFSNPPHNAQSPLQFVTDTIARLTILSDGKVGIGTNLPSELLHIDDNLKVDSIIYSREARFSVDVGIGSDNPSEKLHVVGNIKSDSTIFARDVNFSNLPVYADEAAATAGGLATGALYRTTAGAVRIKL